MSECAAVCFEDAPKEIWLVVPDDDDNDALFSDLDSEGILWCEGQIGGNDIKYVRADLASVQRNELLAMLRLACDVIDRAEPATNEEGFASQFHSACDTIKATLAKAESQL